jgi:hypothetical protein
MDEHSIEHLFHIYVIIIFTGASPRRPGRMGIRDINVDEERVRREERIIVVQRQQ